LCFNYFVESNCLIKKDLKDAEEYNYAKELLSLIILKLYHLGQTIPRNYIETI
jgi:hypothetical protein